MPEAEAVCAVAIAVVISSPRAGAAVPVPRRGIRKLAAALLGTASRLRRLMTAEDAHLAETIPRPARAHAAVLRCDARHGGTPIDAHPLPPFRCPAHMRMPRLDRAVAGRQRATVLPPRRAARAWPRRP